MPLRCHAFAVALTVPSLALGQAPTITIHAGTVLDGRGGVARNTTIVVAGSHILRLDPALTTATYDLGRLTVMPGGIDTHVHLTSHFDANGRAHNDPGGAEPLQQTVLYAEENAYHALLAGITTVQSIGSTLDLMAEHGTFFDPNLYLVFQNYFDNKAQFLGIENYTEEGFAQMHRAVPLVLAVFKQALRRPKLRVVFGTDAVAGAFGKNWEELIYRVQVGGQTPMAAIVSATSLAAQSLQLADTIGALAPGLEADLIGLDGNPLDDITALR